MYIPTLTVFLVVAVASCMASILTPTQSERVPAQADVLKPVIVNPPTWSALFETEKFNMSMKQTVTVNLTITLATAINHTDYEFHVLADDPSLVHIDHIVRGAEFHSTVQGLAQWTGNFTMDGIFLGHTPVYVELRRANFMPERSGQSMEVIVMRRTGRMDVLFHVIVASFVMLLYVNFGAVLDLDDLKRILMCPIGPAIGFVGQFLVMPLLSFAIGYFLFRDDIELRLGLFFTGSTPGGGASNIFTVVLNANLNLSITMTAISNLAAFGMMPLWIFTLGGLIFRDGNFAIPYKAIASMSFSLVLPLCVGIALQKYAPGVAKKMSKLLKPVALMLIIVITVFSFTINSFMFKLFSWKIIFASCALPWIGYIIGWLLAILCRQSAVDALTIAIETGIQNTGIAIFMLTFTLPQPQADMTSAVPVANSMMVPLPLLLLYVLRKCFGRTSIEQVEEPPTKEAKHMEVEAIMEKPKQTTPPAK